MHLRRFRATSAASVFVLAAAACGGGDAAAPAVRTPASLMIVSGDAQSGPVGTPLGTPLVVRVRDAQQRAVPGTEVRWTVADGNGTLSVSSSTTDSRGDATVTWTLGTLAVPGRVTVSVAGVTPVSIGATTLPGPAATIAADARTAVLVPGELAPFAAAVVPGDTVRLIATVRDQFGNLVANAPVSWTSLTPDFASVDASGLVRGVAEGKASIAASVGGKTEALRVWVSGAASSVGPCSGAAALELRVGEVRSFAANAGGDLCLSGGAAGAEYAVMSYAASSVANLRTSFSITASGIGAASADVTAQASSIPSGSLSLIPASATASRAALAQDEGFEDQLRRREQIELTPRIPAARALRRSEAARTAGSPSLSRARVDLKVGDFLSLNAQANKGCSDMQMRTARVAAVSERAVILADTLNPAGGFTDDEYREFALAFDRDVYPSDVQAFGAPSDLDGNGKVLIFYTSAVNALTPAGSASYVGGFFYGRDLFPKTGNAQLQGCGGSNEAEMFYMLVPDPTGLVNGNKRTKEFVARGSVGVIAHEFQHLINASRRIYVTGANDFEDTWLNEGLSHIAEELLFYRISGIPAREKIDLARLRSTSATLDAFNKYGIGNFGRLISYLKAPESASPFANNDDLETRGAAWQFLRYAADRAGQSDGDLWMRLVNSKQSGTDNLRTALGANLDEWYRDWSVANFVDDMGLSGLDARYTGRSWNYRSVVSALSSSGSGYPLLTRTLSNGMPAFLTLNGGSAGYVRLAVPATRVASIIARNGTQPLPATVRLTLVRTK
jgi:hypothetical protein